MTAMRMPVEYCGEEEKSKVLVDASTNGGGVGSVVVGRAGVATTMQSASSGPLHSVRWQLGWQLCTSIHTHG